jgi:DHA1 family inner membrane transport protein
LLCLCVCFIGTGVALAPAVQTRLMDIAGDAQTLAAASMHSAFNIANAAGAWLGGLAISAGYGYASTGWVGAAMGLVGLTIFGISCWMEQRGPLSSDSGRADQSRDQRDGPTGEVNRDFRPGGSA